MKKSAFILTVTISLLLVFSVIAAGSSTGSRTNTASDPTTNFATDQVTDETTDERPDARRVKVARRQLSGANKRAVREACEDTDNRRERIKCRLDYIRDNKEEFEAPYNRPPEACRDLEKGDQGKCVALYQKSQACYDKKRVDKIKCFKRIANFAKAHLKDERGDGRGQKARDYAILLLYEIQEKIEGAIEKDRVDSDVAAAAINKIVEIKQDILDGKTKREITPKMLQLRTLIKNIKSAINQDNDEEETENEIETK
jgi:hypothetical protein